MSGSVVILGSAEVKHAVAEAEDEGKDGKGAILVQRKTFGASSDERTELGGAGFPVRAEVSALGLNIFTFDITFLPLPTFLELFVRAVPATLFRC